MYESSIDRVVSWSGVWGGQDSLRPYPPHPNRHFMRTHGAVWTADGPMMTAWSAPLCLARTIYFSRSALRINNYNIGCCLKLVKPEKEGLSRSSSSNSFSRKIRENLKKDYSRLNVKKQKYLETVFRFPAQALKLSLNDEPVDHDLADGLFPKYRHEKPV